MGLANPDRFVNLLTVALLDRLKDLATWEGGAVDERGRRGGEGRGEERRGERRDESGEEKEKAEGRREEWREWG